MYFAFLHQNHNMPPYGFFYHIKQPVCIEHFLLLHKAGLSYIRNSPFIHPPPVPGLLQRITFSPVQFFLCNKITLQVLRPSAQLRYFRLSYQTYIRTIKA